MNRCVPLLAALALTAGCAAGGGNPTTSAAPPVISAASSRVAMAFTPAANAKKVIVSVGNSQSPALLIASSPQTATLANNVAISVTCGTQSSGSASGSTTNAGTSQTCTVATLLPPGQYEISVAQLDFLNSLISDLNQFITLAAGTDFFGNFFNSSPTPAPSPTAS